MSQEKQRAIASQGGKAAHVKGRAHIWTREEAQSAGRKGGIRRKYPSRLHPIEEQRSSPYLLRYDPLPKRTEFIVHLHKVLAQVRTPLVDQPTAVKAMEVLLSYLDGRLLLYPILPPPHRCTLA